MILLVAHEKDEHGDAVAGHLTQMGAAWLRLGARELFENHLYAVRPLDIDFGRGALFCRLRDKAGAPDDEGDSPRITTIYWRRPYQLSEALMRRFPSAQELAAAEAMSAFQQAVSAFPAGAFPLGHPDAQHRAENKLLQLMLARRNGWNVPETVVGNDSEALRDLLDGHEACVVKPLAQPVAYDEADRSVVEHLLWCREFPSRVLAAKLAGVRSAQMLVQQSIKKRADWRVTVLPHVMLCCEIETSGLPPGEPDWRKHTMSLPHRIIEPPEEFQRQVRRYLKSINLTAGCLDFAIDESGTPWFLEINPNGQWLWMEQLTGHSFSAEVARALVCPPEAMSEVGEESIL